jgi:hypothetical protein
VNFGAGDILASSSCTSRAAYSAGPVAASWIRLNITALSGGGNVQFILNLDKASVPGLSNRTSPAGANGRLQYNNNGAFGGISNWVQTNGGADIGPTAGGCIRFSSNATFLCDGVGAGAGLGGPWTLVFGGAQGRLQLKDQGTCTMAAGTCSAQALGSTYTGTPLGFVTWAGGGTCTGILKAASTTTTVTPSSSVGTDTCVVNWIALGN